MASVAGIVSLRWRRGLVARKRWPAGERTSEMGGERMDSTCWVEAESSGVLPGTVYMTLFMVCWQALSCTKRPRHCEVGRTPQMALLLMHLHDTTWVRILDARALRHRLISICVQR